MFYLDLISFFSLDYIDLIIISVLDSFVFPVNRYENLFKSKLIRPFLASIGIFCLQNSK